MKRTESIGLGLLMILLASQAFAQQQIVPMKGHLLDRESLQRNLVGATPMLRAERLKLQITLKVCNKDSFDKLADEQNDPNSPYFHHKFSGEELARDFGPSATDYQAVKSWVFPCSAL